MNDKKSFMARWWAVIVVLAIGLVIILLPHTSNAPTPVARTNRDVALSCTTDMYTQFHIHPILKIVINGVSREIPANIGIVDGCMNPLHTHDNTGKLHVESPEKRDFTLADFFAVWKQPFTKDQILDATVDATHTIRETVNGVEVQDYENTILRDGDQIVISYETK